jgi:hypothetical protein
MIKMLVGAYLESRRSLGPSARRFRRSGLWPRCGKCLAENGIKHLIVHGVRGLGFPVSADTRASHRQD